MWAMTSRDKQELDAYRATGLTPSQVNAMQAAQDGMAPLPFEDHNEATVADYAWYAAEGVPGLLEEEG